MNEDFESHIPLMTLQLSQGLTELRVKTVATTEDGFTENRIERVKVQKPEDSVARPFYRFKPVSDVISLCVKDVKMAQPISNNCWKVFNHPFRKVAVYGKIEVHNLLEFKEKTVYKFQIDDGTGSVPGFLNITRKNELEVSNQLARLAIEKNKLKQQRSTGINIRGKFLPPDSEENLTIIKNLAILQNATSRNIRQQSKKFELGPVDEKVLISAWLYLDKDQEVKLGILDLWPNDEIEGAWKQHLTKIYNNEYLKTPIVSKSV